jgi:YD repeat-containing protein
MIVKNSGGKKMRHLLIGLFLLLSVLDVRSAHADVLLYTGVTPNGYSPALPTPQQAAQWAADYWWGPTPSPPYIFTVGSVRGIDPGTGSISFNATANWNPSAFYTLTVTLVCQRDDGSTYAASAGEPHCHCPASQTWDPVLNVCAAGFNASASPPQKSDLGGGCCVGRALVAEPINPSNGNTYRSDSDLAGPSEASALSFKRFYNSTDSTSTDLSVGWRHSFSRSVQAIGDVAPYISGNPANSSLYPDASSACVSGFAEIQSQTPRWQGATPTYANGVCTLTKSGATIGTVAILTASSAVAVQISTVVGFQAIRDDGQTIRFTNQAGVLIAPPGTTLKLRQTPMGYTLTDGEDNVETYDGTGKLLSLTSRAGVVRTMGYDTSNRLSTVTDSFGHSLSLTYDSQNRLSSVTRQ